MYLPNPSGFIFMTPYRTVSLPSQKDKWAYSKLSQFKAILIILPVKLYSILPLNMRTLSLSLKHSPVCLDN